jgi:hypothetical protein
MALIVPDTVHDWTFWLSKGGEVEWGIGIRESDWSKYKGSMWEPFASTPRTQIFVGPTEFTTNLSAYSVLAFGAIGLLVGALVLSFIISRFSKRQHPG